MCFFNAMSWSAVRVAARYRRKFDAVEAWKEIMREKEPSTIVKQKELYQYRLAEGMYNIPAYNDPHCIIVNAETELQIVDWGLIARSMKPADVAKYRKGNWFKNARAEDIFETWPYRNLIRHKRCLIPSTGYYEYHYNSEGKTQPYFIYLADREIFSMAGLWDEWQNPETGETIKTFAQITTAANGFTEKIHNGGKNPFRMPLILSEKDERRWLVPDLTDEQIRELMKVYPATGMVANPVDKTFKDQNPYDKMVIRETADAGQGTLDGIIFVPYPEICKLAVIKSMLWNRQSNFTNRPAKGA